LITVGEAFHWFDRPLMMQRAWKWLAPGGSFATLGCFGVAAGSESWQVQLLEVVKKWAAGRSLDAQSHTHPWNAVRGAAIDEEILKAAGFIDVITCEFQLLHVWSVDSILGNLRSTASCSRRKLQGNAEQFEAEVKHALLTDNSDGQFPEVVCFAYTIGRKP
jgi:hypothetical protein